MTEVLQLIGSRAAAEILIALGRGPLRTRQLTEQVRGASPRSVYRSVEELETHNLVQRHTAPGVPSKTVIQLTDPAGCSLSRLLRSFTLTPVGAARRQCGEHRKGAWLELLGELWEGGFIAELSRGPRSLGELVDALQALTYDQVKRRVAQSLATGIVDRRPREGNRRCYELTGDGRRFMAIISGIGHWQCRHADSARVAAGLDTAEMATLLRTVLPLARVPAYRGGTIELQVAGATDDYGYPVTDSLQGRVDRDGNMRLEDIEGAECDGSAGATIKTWSGALLEGNRGRFRVRGNVDFVDACLRQLHEALWGRRTGE